MMVIKKTMLLSRLVVFLDIDMCFLKRRNVNYAEYELEEKKHSNKFI